MSAALDYTAAELAELELDYERARRRAGFERAEIRHTRNRRALDCGHTIPPRDPYRYYVAKLAEVVELIQVTQCDVCMRHGNHY